MSESATIQLLRLIFREYRRDSWRELNQELRGALSMTINLRFEIQEGDWDLIYREFRYHFWAGTSENGHHYGEGHYSLAAREYRPAAIEYERFFGRAPFILNGKRLSCGSRIGLDGRYWKLTGWRQDNQSINLVTCDNGNDSTGRRLKSIDAKEWRSLRKEVVAA